MRPPVRVLIADDSPSVRRLLASYVAGTDDLQVAATVGDGYSAVQEVERLRPDVLTLDVDMPEVDGLVALQHIMTHCPTPTVMISGLGGRAAERTLEALDIGAVDFVLKYTTQARRPEALKKEILAKIRAAAGVRTVRNLQATSRTSSDLSPAALVEVETTEPGVVVLGASTGGPVALRQLLAALPADFPRPIVVVQHIPDSFTPVLARQLNRNTPLSVQAAEDGAPLRPGEVLVAPGDVHLKFVDGRVHYDDGPAVLGHRPAIDVTMHSAARTFGHRACGVLLTGMGTDGVEGLLAIRRAGGDTLAQDESSSIVWGMPQRAYEEGSVDLLASPEGIARHLIANLATSTTSSAQYPRRIQQGGHP